MKKAGQWAACWADWKADAMADLSVAVMAAL